MANSLTLSDPETYPVVMAISERNIKRIPGDTSIAIFGIEDGHPIVGAACRYSEKYLMDVNPFDASIPSSSSGRQILYELAPTSSTAADAEVLLKMWVSATSFFSYRSLDIVDIRQAVNDLDTVHKLYVSPSFHAMVAVDVAGVSYWPSIEVAYAGTAFTDDATADFSGTVSVGTSPEFVVMDGDDSGLCWITLKWTTKWYLDQARLVESPSPPSTLPSLDGESLVRLVFPAEGRFSLAGEVVEDAGTAAFVGIPTGDTAPLIGIIYAGTSANVVFVGESTVKLKENGLPDQVGNNSAVYELPAP